MYGCGSFSLGDAEGIIGGVVPMGVGDSVESASIAA